jgi:hypothetical protein
LVSCLRYKVFVETAACRIFALRDGLVKEYRVTKYNPAFRNLAGGYTREEWTSVKDVGRLFGGIVLTQEEYGRIEYAYVQVALAFLREAGLSSLRVQGLENGRGHDLAFGENTVLTIDQVGDVIRRVLNEEFWCRLEGDDGFVHVGWDYYMYIGVSRLCPEAEARAGNLGLYVEEFRSPYNEAS